VCSQLTLRARLVARRRTALITLAALNGASSSSSTSSSSSSSARAVAGELRAGIAADMEWRPDIAAVLEESCAVHPHCLDSPDGAAPPPQATSSATLDFALQFASPVAAARNAARESQQRDQRAAASQRQRHGGARQRAIPGASVAVADAGAQPGSGAHGVAEVRRRLLPWSLLPENACTDGMLDCGAFADCLALAAPAAAGGALVRVSDAHGRGGAAHGGSVVALHDERRRGGSSALLVASPDWGPAERRRALARRAAALLQQQAEASPRRQGAVASAATMALRAWGSLTSWADLVAQLSPFARSAFVGAASAVCRGVAGAASLRALACGSGHGGGAALLLIPELRPTIARAALGSLAGSVSLVDRGARPAGDRSAHGPSSSSSSLSGRDSLFELPVETAASAAVAALTASCDAVTARMRDATAALLRTVDGIGPSDIVPRLALTTSLPAAAVAACAVRIAGSAAVGDVVPAAQLHTQSVLAPSDALTSALDYVCLARGIGATKPSGPAFTRAAPSLRWRRLASSDAHGSQATEHADSDSAARAFRCCAVHVACAMLVAACHDIARGRHKLPGANARQRLAARRVLLGQLSAVPVLATAAIGSSDIADAHGAVSRCSSDRERETVTLRCVRLALLQCASLTPALDVRATPSNRHRIAQLLALERGTVPAAALELLPVYERLVGGADGEELDDDAADGDANVGAPIGADPHGRNSPSARSGDSEVRVRERRLRSLLRRVADACAAGAAGSHAATGEQAATSSRLAPALSRARADVLSAAAAVVVDAAAATVHAGDDGGRWRERHIAAAAAAVERTALALGLPVPSDVAGILQQHASAASQPSAALQDAAALERRILDALG
jgi:hypothetical protein